MKNSAVNLDQTMLNYADVAVVMITRNEELAIEKVVKDAFLYLPGCSVFVIDGSSDRTSELATLAGAKVVQEPGGGFGPALHCALLYPGPEFKIVATVDADDTYPAEVFPELVKLVRSGIDVAGTNRLTLTPTEHMPFINWVANTTFNIFASLSAKRIVRDVQSGQRSYKKDEMNIFEELNKMKNESRKSRDGGSIINIVRALSGVMPNCI